MMERRRFRAGCSVRAATSAARERPTTPATPGDHGSGELNPADGTYRNEFPRSEDVDISLTVQILDQGQVNLATSTSARSSDPKTAQILETNAPFWGCGKIG